MMQEQLFPAARGGVGVTILPDGRVRYWSEAIQKTVVSDSISCALVRANGDPARLTAELSRLGYQEVQTGKLERCRRTTTA